MIFNMEDDEFMEFVKKNPDIVDKIEKLNSVRMYSIGDPVLSKYVDWESLDMIDMKIKVLEARKNDKPLPDGYEKILTLLPEGKDDEDAIWD